MPSTSASATRSSRFPRYDVVLLDRDGVINHDSPDYIKNVGEWLPIEGSIEAIVRLQQAGTRVAVCTNQAGIGRGIIEPADLEAIHEALQNRLEALGGERVAVYFCPHHPDDGCSCRKPAPGLLNDAMSDLHTTPDRVCFIGDSDRDLEAAERAGCQGILVLTGHGSDTLERYPDALTVDNLAAFARRHQEG